MADDMPVSPTPSSRTGLVLIQTPKGEDPSLSFHRQSVVVLNGEAFVRPTRIVSKAFSTVASETVTLASGLTLSVAQIAEAMSLFGDR